MKTIKIFLASSEELKDERLEMTDLVSRLNQTFKGRGIQLELKRWEYLDSSMGDERKQDEYNKVLRECDICLVLFWRKFGSYTGEELDVAYQCHKNKVKPEKIYVFFKNPDADDVTSELKEFIKSYENRYGGHFFNKFLNVDTLKLEFLLQFELYQKDQLGEKAIEVRNEHVYVDNEAMVDLNNIPFAANNEGFKKRQAKLKELEEEIEKKWKELDEKKTALQVAKDQQANLPDVAGLQMFVDMAQKAVNETEDSLQALLNRKNELKDDFEREQQNLFNTARRITEQRGRNISERMARAIEAFESGDARRADIILDEAEKDFEEARMDFRITKKVSVQALEEQIQRASYKMSNDSIPIEERVAKTLEIYEEADAFAQEINYDQKKYIYFLWDYSGFLNAYAQYSKAKEVCDKTTKICEETYGKEHSCTADSYHKFGSLYDELGDYVKAMDYHKLALNIREKLLGKNHIDTALSYNGIGIINIKLGNYEKALDCFQQALDVWEKELGKGHHWTAAAYTNTGNVYYKICNYDKALKNYKRALEIYEGIGEKDKPSTAHLYFNIGLVYSEVNDYKKALDYYKKAMFILKKALGEEHPDTTRTYNNIGNIYNALGNHDKALEYQLQAIANYEKILGKEHPEIAVSYNDIGCVYSDIGDYNKALEYLTTALNIREKVIGKEHLDTASSYNNIAHAYLDLGNYDKALEYFHINLDIIKKNLGNDHIKTASSYNSIGIVYGNLGDYDKALKYFKLAMKIREKNLGMEHFDTAESYYNIALAYHLTGKIVEALPYAEKAVAAFPEDTNHIDTLACVYEDLGRNQEALEKFELCLRFLKEQKGQEERIKETKEKIAALKELMKSNS